MAHGSPCYSTNDTFELQNPVTVKITNNTEKKALYLLVVYFLEKNYYSGLKYQYGGKVYKLTTEPFHSDQTTVYTLCSSPHLAMSLEFVNFDGIFQNLLAFTES